MVAVGLWVGSLDLPSTTPRAPKSWRWKPCFCREPPKSLHESAQGLERLGRCPGHSKW